MRSHVALALVATVLACSMSAIAEETPYQRFLVPLYTGPLMGTFGSIWEVETWLRNSGPESFTVIPEPSVCAVMCPGPHPGGRLSGPTPQPLNAVFPSESGVLVHVPREHVAKITFQSRFRDLSRDADSAGTEVPVVPENEMVSGPIRMLNIPVGTNMRATLRVYALPEYASPEVEVRYFSMPHILPGGRSDGSVTRVLRSERVKLRTYPATGGILLHPSFAAVANFETLPEILGQEAVWIEVVPVMEGLPIWAFVSVTNNRTQQVTLVTPSRK